MFLLDTNTWIGHLRGRLPALSARVSTTPTKELCTCAIIRAELVTGVHKAKDPARERIKVESAIGLLRSFPFDDRSAERYALVRADLEKRGMMIGGNDLMIAAIALVNDLKVVTHNTAEFARIPMLQMEDWQ